MNKTKIFAISALFVVTLLAALPATVNATTPNSCNTTGKCLLFQSSDPNDSYQRYWAVFSSSPGTYQGSGNWQATPLTGCHETHYSPDWMQCDPLPSSSHIWVCMSVPDTGFSPGYGMDGYYYNNGSPYYETYATGITEGNCAEFTGP